MPDRGDVLRAVDGALDLVRGREVEELAQRCDASEVGDRGPHVVDQLLGDQGLVVVHGVEDLADGQRRGGVGPDQAQCLLVLGGCAVLQPEGPVRLQVLSEPGRLGGGEPVVCVVEQGQVGAELTAYGVEHGRDVAEVGVGVPVLHEGAGLLVEDGRAGVVGAVHAVHGLQTGDARLYADGLVALGEPGPHRVEEFGEVVPAEDEGQERGGRRARCGEGKRDVLGRRAGLVDASGCLPADRPMCRADRQGFKAGQAAARNVPIRSRPACVTSRLWV
jgi:hypothetical protein